MAERRKRTTSNKTKSAAPVETVKDESQAIAPDVETDSPVEEDSTPDSTPDESPAIASEEPEETPTEDVAPSPSAVEPEPVKEATEEVNPYGNPKARFCLKCGQEKAFDYMRQKPICPVRDKNCPRYN